MSRAFSLAIRPRRDETIPRRVPGPAAGAAATPPADAELLRAAEALGIPWRRLLAGEIEAEQRLRRYLADVDADVPLPSALAILSFAALQSWRVRDRVQALAAEARGDSARAPRELRGFWRRFVGREETDRAALAEHLAFAYQRVLLLQRVCRAAARARGTAEERLAAVCAKARCCFEDAEWAIRHEASPERAARLEACVRRVREEGFLVPRARTEARSLAELRRIVQASDRRNAGGVGPGRSRVFSVSAPRRLEPSDAS